MILPKGAKRKSKEENAALGSGTQNRLLNQESWIKENGHQPGEHWKGEKSLRKWHERKKGNYNGPMRRESNFLLGQSWRWPKKKKIL